MSKPSIVIHAGGVCFMKGMIWSDKVIHFCWARSRGSTGPPDPPYAARANSPSRSYEPRPGFGSHAGATRELQEIVAIAAEPRFVRIFRWPRSMAQPIVGHPARVAEIEARVAAIPGLHLAGYAYQGIGIPDCIRLGRQAAGRILAG